MFDADYIYFLMKYTLIVIAICFIIGVVIPFIFSLPILLARKIIKIIKKPFQKKSSKPKVLNSNLSVSSDSSALQPKDTLLSKEPSSSHPPVIQPRDTPLSKISWASYPFGLQSKENFSSESPSRSPTHTELQADLHDPYRWDTGDTGERYTYEVLLPLPGYKKFIRNCYLPKSDGTYTEIDLVLLHESGIYVLESKNYSGWIYGKEDEQQWKQLLPKGRRDLQETYFFNPIIQNKTHVYWLRNCIGTSYPVYSCIVFSDRCVLKDIVLTSDEHFVVNRRQLFRKIRRIFEKEGTKLSKAKIDYLYSRLYPFTQVSDEQKALHIKTIHQKRQQALLQDRTCPRCGGKLVVRTVKKGERAGKQILGCSNYPKCRFVENLD